MLPAIPIATFPTDKYDCPFISPTATAARANCSIFSLTSSGISVPVSYTHLDVYKSQSFATSACVSCSGSPNTVTGADTINTIQSKTHITLIKFLLFFVTKPSFHIFATQHLGPCEIYIFYFLKSLWTPVSCCFQDQNQRYSGLQIILFPGYFIISYCCFFIDRPVLFSRDMCECSVTN